MSQDPALFVGQCDADGVIHLAFPSQQKAYCKAKMAMQCVDVMIAPAGMLKSRLQECGFHAMIRPWQLSEGIRPDDLKRDILRHVFGEMEHTNPITGEITMVLREPHTSKLSRAKYSELIERTLEVAAECGVILEAPNEYKNRKAKEARTQQRTAARELVTA